MKWTRRISDTELEKKIYYQQKELDGIQSAIAYSATLADYTPSVESLRLMGSTVVAEPLGIGLQNTTSSYGLTDGTAVFICFPIRKSETITGVVYFAGGSTGNFTADNYNGIGLYSFSTSGVLTLVAQTANDPTIWKKTAGSWYSVAFTSAYPATAGIYYVCLLYNSSAQSTAPGILQAAANTGITNVQLFNFSNSIKINGTLASQSSLPSPISMSSITVSTARQYVALY